MSNPSQSLSYKDAGVDIDAGNRLIERIKNTAKRTRRAEVLGGLGGFGALCEIPAKYQQPVLVTGTDGVGTKIEIAKELEKYGFEIYIGSQSDKNFWKSFFNQVGKIDILLDDGGHGNAQQIITLSEAIQHINDDGLIAIEDTHASYLKKFGNPSKHSFINYSKYLIDVVNSRFPDVKNKKNNGFKNKIYSISFYESIVAIKINSKKSIEPNILRNSETKTIEVADLRHSDYFPKIDNYLNKNLPVVKKLPILKKIIRYLFYTHNFIIKIKYYFKLKKYFK